MQLQVEPATGHHVAQAQREAAGSRVAHQATDAQHGVAARPAGQERVAAGALHQFHFQRVGQLADAATGAEVGRVGAHQAVAQMVEDVAADVGDQRRSQRVVDGAGQQDVGRGRGVRVADQQLGGAEAVADVELERRRVASRAADVVDLDLDLRAGRGVDRRDVADLQVLGRLVGQRHTPVGVHEGEGGLRALDGAGLEVAAGHPVGAEGGRADVVVQDVVDDHLAGGVGHRHVLCRHHIARRIDQQHRVGA